MAIDISKFKKSNVLVVGDLIIDEYIWGDVERVSTEAPVPVVTVKEDNYALGGAGNVVNNLVALGANVSVVGVSGIGANGNQMMDRFNELGVDVNGVYLDSRRPTTKKTRVLASNQQVLRIDYETSKPVTNKAVGKMIEAIHNKIPQSDIVLVPDFGKGTLTKPLLTEIFATAKKHNKITIVNPFGDDYSRYMGATILTPNAKEASIVTGIDILGKTSIIKAGSELLKTTRAEGILLTCGKDGIVILGKSAKPFVIESEAKQVFDVSGARDTVISALGLSLATGGSFKDAATVANVAAGIVVGKLGTATVSEKEIILELMAFSGKASREAGDTIFKKKKELY